MESHDLPSGAIHQKFREVPGDLQNLIVLGVVERLRIVSQKFINLASVGAVDHRLLHDGEFGLEFLSDQLFDVSVRALLLTEKLIAREGQNFKTFVSILVVQLHKLRIDTFCESSL